MCDRGSTRGSFRPGRSHKTQPGSARCQRPQNLPSRSRRPRNSGSKHPFSTSAKSGLGDLKQLPRFQSNVEAGGHALHGRARGVNRASSSAGAFPAALRCHAMRSRRGHAPLRFALGYAPTTAAASRGAAPRRIRGIAEWPAGQSRVRGPRPGWAAAASCKTCHAAVIATPVLGLVSRAAIFSPDAPANVSPYTCHSTVEHQAPSTAASSEFGAPATRARRRAPAAAPRKVPATTARQVCLELFSCPLRFQGHRHAPATRASAPPLAPPPVPIRARGTRPASRHPPARPQADALTAGRPAPLSVRLG